MSSTSFSNSKMIFRTLISFYGTTAFGFLADVLAISFLSVTFPETKNLSRVVALLSVLTALVHLTTGAAKFLTVYSSFSLTCVYVLSPSLVICPAFVKCPCYFLVMLSTSKVLFEIMSLKRCSSKVYKASHSSSYLSKITCFFVG